MKLRGKTVFITGCTGFLGSHLARNLVKLKSTCVRGLIQNPFEDTSQLIDLPVEKVYGDMTSFSAMAEATRGCDIIVHCAVGKPDENVIGTKNLVKAAVLNKIKKFIHISSSAVFGYSPSVKDITEGRLRNRISPGNYLTSYCFSKRELEKIVFAYYDHFGLPIVILRPTNIYGPNSLHWTIKPIMLLEKQCCVLVNGGHTPSNAVYVDDVVKAIILTIQKDDAVGHAIVISSNENINWKKFFQNHSRILPTSPPIINISKQALHDIKKQQQIELYKKFLSNPKQAFFSFFMNMKNNNAIIDFIVSIGKKTFIKTKFRRIAQKTIMKNHSPSNGKNINSNILSLSKIPNLYLEKSFTFPYKFPIDKAKKILGFNPDTSFDEGMMKTKEWLVACPSEPEINSSGIIFIPNNPISVHLPSRRTR